MPTQDSHIHFRHIGLSALFMLILGSFCYFVGFSLLMPFILVFLGIHLFFFRKANPRLFMNLGLLLALIVFGAYAFIKYTNVSEFYIPVATVAMLTMLLFNDLQLAYLMSFASSIFVTFIVGGDISLMVIFFIGGLTAAYLVKGSRTRGDLIKAGFVIGLIQSLGAIFTYPDLHFIVTKEFALNYLRPFLINGFLVIGVVMVSSKIFESLFGVLTNFSLLELSDFNHPLLRRMVMEAPGTYHHSLVVSNLSEAAADAIGANALLTRVGAYYHDIGKMVNPEYFTENQLVDGNKHDTIEPTMSRLVILNHVKEGIELAKKYKLNSLIIDFIPQHHGTSLMHYFYQKALETAKGEEDVTEEHFRYPGPKPQTRETAIVMLADSAEGATRALDDPTPMAIEETVRKVINNRFIDGQLDECNLTLKEIDRIARTFSRVLSAMYHARVKYPEKKNSNGNHHRQSAEEDSTSPPKNSPQHKKSASL